MWHNIDEKIVSVKGYCLSSKYKEGKIFGQNKNIKTMGFIEVETESGERGFGENYAAIYAPELLTPTVKFLERFFKGKKVGDKNLINEIYKVPFIGRNGFIKSVSGSVEIALWDLRGKLLKKPTYELFERKNKKIKCYASGGSIIMTEREIIDEIHKSFKSGFNSYKMRVGYQAWDADVKRVESARNNIKKGDLMVDAIMGTINPPWNLHQAQKKIEDLSKFNLRWIEEPLHPDDVENLRLLKEKSSIPIAAGEAYSGKFEYNNLIENKSLDILQFDCTHSGGIEFCQHLSKKCSDKNIENAVHIWGSAVAVSANINLSLSLENISFVEIPIIKLDISEHMWSEKPKISNGFVELSDAPGLGISISDNIKNKFKAVKNTAFHI